MVRSCIVYLSFASGLDLGRSVVIFQSLEHSASTMEYVSYARNIQLGVVGSTLMVGRDKCIRLNQIKELGECIPFKHKDLLIRSDNLFAPPLKKSTLFACATESGTRLIAPKNPNYMLINLTLRSYYILSYNSQILYNNNRLCSLFKCT